MAQPASIAVTVLQRMLTDDSSGINAEIANTITQTGDELPMLAAGSISPANVPAEVEERSGSAVYPSLHIYCERAANELKEKFRAFSGTLDMALELRATHDRPDEAIRITDAYVTAITAVLLRARGRWAECLFYPGAYEITYGPVKRGGKSYVQTCKVRLQVMASV